MFLDFSQRVCAYRPLSEERGRGVSTETLPLTPSELAASISKGFQSYIESVERRQRGSQREYVYASAWRACTRAMALEMLEPDKLPEFSADTLANFRRGKDRERDLLADFTRAGRNSDPAFEVIGREERFTLNDHKGRVVIVGKVDAQLKIGRVAAPMEVKSWNPNLVARIETFEDLFANRWTRSGAHQILAYMLAKEEPLGFFLLDRNGLPLLLEVELEKHLHRIEDFLHRAELALDARTTVIAGKPALPPFINDASECKYCGFYGSVCNPPSFSAGAELIVDEEWIQKVERYADIQAIGEEFEGLDKSIKKKFRGIDLAIVGSVLLEGKWQKDTKYELSDEAKAKIDEIKAPFAKKVDKGKFFLTVTKI
jgi:hypothetical protein